MAKYIGKRLIYMVVTLFVIVVLTFTLMKILPGSPFDEERFLRLTPEKQTEALARYGLDQPIYMQFFKYFGNILITIVSLMVNGQGASLKDVEEYLGQWGLGTYAQDFYDYAVDMPIYFFKYTGGFCELFDLTTRCCTSDKVSFFEEYLHWGPGYFDLLNERMEAWANAQ